MDTAQGTMASRNLLTLLLGMLLVAGSQAYGESQVATWQGCRACGLDGAAAVFWQMLPAILAALRCGCGSVQGRVHGPVAALNQGALPPPALARPAALPAPPSHRPMPVVLTGV